MERPYSGGWVHTMEGGSDLDPNLVPGQEQRPWVEVRHPDGRSWVVEIAADVFRVGREAGWSDLDLDTDDRRWISRRHFRMERHGRGWTVVEEGSRNGTFLRRAGTLRRVEGTVPLRTGDAVAVLAGMDGVSPLYWELVFHDPDLTAPAPEGGSGAAAAYDWVEGRMFIVDGPVRTEVVGLRPQEHRLVRHLVSRNDEAGGAVLCPYAELIRAVWGDEAGPPHTRDDLARLVYDLRRKLDGVAPRANVLQTVRGFGYRLATVPTSPGPGAGG